MFLCVTHFSNAMVLPIIFNYFIENLLTQFSCQQRKVISVLLIIWQYYMLHFSKSKLTWVTIPKVTSTLGS